jgi:hypothetical protein
MIWTYLRSCYGFNMRLFIGGQEQIFPARWFFCDPDAQHFPNPHGAEASPWLKDGEVNDDWGDDGTLRKLDRGINPGYPGVCSVGNPQWFIDGQLPADFLSGPQSVTPPCCGHTPDFNPDPRCPPWRELVPCPGCVEGYGYRVYTFVVEGGTGDFAFMNGTWQITNGTGCIWSNVGFGPGLGMTLGDPHVNPPIAHVGTYPFGPVVTYYSENPFSCLTTLDNWSVESSIGVGTVPTITLF